MCYKRKKDLPFCVILAPPDAFFYKKSFKKTLPAVSLVRSFIKINKTLIHNESTLLPPKPFLIKECLSGQTSLIKEIFTNSQKLQMLKKGFPGILLFLIKLLEIQGLNKK